MNDLRFHDFMGLENTEHGGSFYWPVAAGDSWYPNIRLWQDSRDANLRDCCIPRGLIHVLAMPLRRRRDGGEILYWYISLIGGDDHSMTTREAVDNPELYRGHRLTLPEVKQILRAFPNPLTNEYVHGLKWADRPLFIIH